MNTGKHGDLRKKLEETCIQTVEVKKDVSHRINRTDFVVTVDFKNQYQAYQKINHLIILTTETNPDKVYKMASLLHTEDIIYFDDNIDYIAKRVKGAMKNVT